MSYIILFPIIFWSIYLFYLFVIRKNKPKQKEESSKVLYNCHNTDNGTDAKIVFDTVGDNCGFLKSKIEKYE